MPSRTLNVVVSGDASGLNRQLAQVERQTSKTERSFLSLGKSGGVVSRGMRDVGKGAAYALGAGGFGGGLYAVFDVTKKVVTEFRESQAVSRQTGAVLKSTGAAAGLTAKQVGDLANAMSKKSGIDDETIQTGENMLLTFTKIRNETGKGRDIFNQATVAVTDMAVAMNSGATPSAEKLRTTAILVGKALNDPIRGSTALRRVGVALTKQQQDQIKALENTGHHMQAQRIILRELSNEFGGSAARQRTAAKSLNVTLGNLAEQLGAVLAPKMDAAANHLNKFIDEIQRGRGEGGRFRRQVEAMAKDIAPFIQMAARAGSVVAANFGKIATAVRIATTGLRFWGRVAITTNRAVLDLAEAVVSAGRSFVGFARGGVEAVADGFNTIKRAASAVIAPVKWLLDHIPRIHIPKVNLGPLHLGDPRPGWEQFMAGINAMPGFPTGVPGGTLSKAGQLASRFGLRMTSGYRSPAHNRAAGGVEGSLHTHGSPSNPGAIDLVGSMGNMRRAEAYAREHFHPKELLIHDAGSGVHLHVGFGDPRGAEKARAIANASSAGTYSFRDLEALWVKAGGRRAAAPIMAHIAQAESGGNPMARNPSGASGLWQILGQVVPGNVFDPMVNARNAISKSGNGRNLHPWDASRPAWQRFVGTGGTYTGSAGSGGGGGGGGSARPAKTPYEKLENRLGYIDLEVDAGALTDVAGAQQKIQAINTALPHLTGSNRVRAMGERRTAQQTINDQKKKIADRTRADWQKVAQQYKAAQRARTVNRTIDNPWLQAFLDHQDFLVASGVLTQEQADANKIVALQGALPGLRSEKDKTQALNMIADLTPGAGDAVSAEGARLSHIDAQVRAGDLTEEQGRAQKIASIQDALGLWNLTDDARLELRGELNDLLKENTAAQEEQNKLMQDSIDAQKTLADELQQTRQYAQQVSGTSENAILQYMTNSFSKQMGFTLSGRALSPSYGAARRA